MKWILITLIAASYLGRAEELESVDPLFVKLYEVAVTAVLKEHPPVSSFTVLLYFGGENSPKPRQEARRFPLEVEKRILTNAGAKEALFVPYDKLNFPSTRSPAIRDEMTIYPQLIQKGTSQSVQALRVDSLIWTGSNQVEVCWSFSSGALSGHGGMCLLKFAEGHWKYVHSLADWTY
jgi:hypothetical protein